MLPASPITDRHHIRMPRIAKMRPMPPAPGEKIIHLREFEPRAGKAKRDQRRFQHAKRAPFFRGDGRAADQRLQQGKRISHAAIR